MGLPPPPNNSPGDNPLRAAKLVTRAKKVTSAPSWFVAVPVPRCQEAEGYLWVLIFLGEKREKQKSTPMTSGLPKRGEPSRQVFSVQKRCVPNHLTRGKTIKTLPPSPFARTTRKSMLFNGCFSFGLDFKARPIPQSKFARAAT